jgi:hypothetical protein
MRRFVLELTLGPELAAMTRAYFERISCIEFLELLRVDTEQGMKLFIADLTLEEGVAIGDVGFEHLQVLSVLRSEGRRHTCLVRAVAPRDMLGFFRGYDMDLLFDLPTRISRERTVVTVVGERSEVSRFIKLIERVGEVRVVSAEPADFHDRDLLDRLTPRQREVVVAAVREGYYDYPRRLNSGRLAARLGLSKATVVEHLRKAEGRLMTALLAGQ